MVVQCELKVLSMLKNYVKLIGLHKTSDDRPFLYPTKHIQTKMARAFQSPDIGYVMKFMMGRGKRT